MKLADRRWLLIAPRLLETWLGDGFYYRALDIAQTRNESLRFTRFFGVLVERYLP